MLLYLFLKKVLKAIHKIRKWAVECSFIDINVFLLIVVIVILYRFYLKLHFDKLHCRKSVSGQKILYRSDKDKITFNAIEKYRYELQKSCIETPFKNFYFHLRRS